MTLIDFLYPRSRHNKDCHSMHALLQGKTLFMELKPISDVTHKPNLSQLLIRCTLGLLWNLRL